MAGSCAASCLLGMRESFTEDGLYATGGWIAECQTRVEAKLWRLRPAKAGADKSLFFYEVTSSYFETAAKRAKNLDSKRKTGMIECRQSLEVPLEGEFEIRRQPIRLSPGTGGMPPGSRRPSARLKG